MKVKGILQEKEFHKADMTDSMRTDHHAPRFWLMVIDQEKASLYRKTVRGLDKIAHLKHRRSVVWNEDDALSETEFLSDIVTWLEKAREEHAFDRLILVASPRVLTEFQNELPSMLRASIIAEIPQNSEAITQLEPSHILEKIAVF